MIKWKLLNKIFNVNDTLVSFPYFEMIDRLGRTIISFRFNDYEKEVVLNMLRDNYYCKQNNITKQQFRIYFVKNYIKKHMKG